jgi:hypothetical protein
VGKDHDFLPIASPSLAHCIVRSATTASRDTFVKVIQLGYPLRHSLSGLLLQERGLDGRPLFFSQYEQYLHVELSE